MRKYIEKNYKIQIEFRLNRIQIAIFQQLK
jgi:hypothetical protein